MWWMVPFPLLNSSSSSSSASFESSSSGCEGCQLPGDEKIRRREAATGNEKEDISKDALRIVLFIKMYTSTA